MATNPEKLELTYDRAKKYLDTPTSHVPGKVWSETVLRGGKQISVKQELADAKSGVQRLEAAVAALTGLVKQLAEKSGTAVDYERINQGTADVLKNGSLSLDVNLNLPVTEKEA